jgi:hypothetical protein
MGAGHREQSIIPQTYPAFLRKSGILNNVLCLSVLTVKLGRQCSCLERIALVRKTSIEKPGD